MHMRRSVRPSPAVVGSSLRVLAACMVIAVPERAIAAPSSIALRWSAPTSCPDVELVRARALALAGPDVAVDADAQVTELAGEFRVVLHVRVGGTTGERSMSAPSCDAAAEAVAVVLALSGTSLPPPPPEAPLIAPAMALPPPLSSSPAPPVSDVAPEEKPVRRPYVRVAAEGALDLGTLPVATYGARLRAALLPRDDVAVGLSGAIWANQSGTVSQSSQGANFSLLSFDAFGCYGLLRRKTLELSPCVVVELDRMSATGKKESSPTTISPVWVSLGIGVEGRWELTRTVGLVLELQGVVPTEGQAFVITNTVGTPVGTVHATSVLAGRAYFGPEVRF